MQMLSVTLFAALLAVAMGLPATHGNDNHHMDPMDEDISTFMQQLRDGDEEAITALMKVNHSVATNTLHELMDPAEGCCRCGRMQECHFCRPTADDPNPVTHDCSKIEIPLVPGKSIGNYEVCHAEPRKCDKTGETWPGHKTCGKKKIDISQKTEDGLIQTPRYSKTEVGAYLACSCFEGKVRATEKDRRYNVKFNEPYDTNNRDKEWSPSYEISDAAWFKPVGSSNGKLYQWCYEADNYLQYGPVPGVRTTKFPKKETPIEDPPYRDFDSFLQWEEIDGSYYAVAEDWPICPVKPACYMYSGKDADTKEKFVKGGCTEQMYCAFSQNDFKKLSNPKDPESSEVAHCSEETYGPKYRQWLLSIGIDCNNVH